MALNFPDSPSLNDIYTDNTSGFSYQWNGTVWISYSPSSLNNIKELDDISGSFNGSQTIFALTVSGTAVSPANAQQLIISLGGVIQNPNTDYSVSGSNIIFTTAPTSGLDFFGTSLGTAYSVGVNTTGDVYNRQTYSPTGITTTFTLSTGYTVGYLDVYQNGVRLLSGTDFTATNGSSFDLTVAADNGDEIEAIGYKVANIYSTEGNLTNLKVTGITTLGTVGAGGTVLTVNGDARITGILTVGSSSITLDGSTNTITVGSGLTLSSAGVIAGVITATAFSGDGSGLTGAGSTVANDTTTNATFYPLFTTITSGTVTATKVSTSKLSFNPSSGTLSATAFSGDGSGLTGAGSTVANDTTTNATFYPLFTQTTSGTVTATKVSTSKLSFNPSTGLVVAGIVSATGIGTLGTNGTGTRTVSTSTPTGGSDGDIWYKY